MSEWIVYKEQYSLMMIDHHSDIGLYEPISRPDTVLPDSIDYMEHQGHYEYAPGKKVATSFIWAVLATSIYGGTIENNLNDSTLIDEDDRMVLYKDAKDIYDVLISKYSIDDLSWLSSGWCPYTAFYFWAECTLEGATVLESHYINDTLDQFIPENYIEKITHLWG